MSIRERLGAPREGILFPLASDQVAYTSDDCYTPRWIFNALGIRFDLDVAAPPGGPWHVPADAYFTAADDGLAQPWHGRVWCNPPYSNYGPWAERFAEHDDGIALMGIVQPEVLWLGTVFDAADAIALVSCDFVRPDSAPVRLRQKVFVATRGLGLGPASRVASADTRYGVLVYGSSHPPALQEVLS